MFRANTPYPKVKSVNFLLLDGGLGDHIAALTALDYVYKNYPWIKPLVFVPDYLKDLTIAAMPVNSDIFSFTDMKRHYDPSKTTKTTKWDGHTSPMKIHLVDYAFLKLCDENPSIEHKNYVKLRKLELEKYVKLRKDLVKFHVDNANYVVITTGYTASVREFPASEINKITAYLAQKNIIPVFLGQTNTKTGAAHVIKGNFDSKVDFTQGVDLIDKTNLLEALSIMDGAKAVIGVDNGLLHLAGMTDTLICGGFTTVSPQVRMPIRCNLMGHKYIAITPDESLGCKFCQEKTNFLYGHNYTNCYYKDNLCTKQMTAEKFIKALEGNL